MRKIVGVMVAAAIMGSMAGCGSKAGGQTTEMIITGAETTEEEAAGAETTEIEAAGTETTETEAAGETTAADRETGENGAAGNGAGQEDGTGEVDRKLTEIHQAVKDAYMEDYIPSAPYDEQAMDAIFGVDSGLYDSFIAEGPMISAHVETFVAVAAKEGKGEAVEKALNQYRDNLIADTMQYPMNIVKIQASQIVRRGDYVFFIMLGSPSAEAEEKGEEESLESAVENNQKGIDVIDGFFK